MADNLCWAAYSELSAIRHGRPMSDQYEVDQLLGRLEKAAKAQDAAIADYKKQVREIHSKCVVQVVGFDDVESRAEFERLITTALQAAADERDERAEEKLDEELRRWLDGIRDHVIKVSGAFDGDIDGAGCDGDGLDVSLAEITQGFNHVFDEHDSAIRAAAEAARVERDEIINAVLQRVGKRWRSMSVEAAASADIQGATAAIVTDQPGAALVAVNMALDHLAEAARRDERERIIEVLKHTELVSPENMFFRVDVYRAIEGENNER